ncbi:hypothetical protein BH23GEM10_BH23GEM10_04800 [soil metagenome]
MDDLRFIRQTMERAGSFTALSGWGMATVGVIGLVAAYMATQQAQPVTWLATWLAAALVAFAVSTVTTLRKASRAGQPVLEGPGRKLMLSFVPPAAAAALLTPVLFQSGQHQLLPAVWLLLFGASVINAGIFSVRAIPVMGVAFMFLGAAALFAPPSLGDVFMATGFGVLHLVVGAVIIRRYGG